VVDATAVEGGTVDVVVEATVVLVVVAAVVTGTIDVVASVRCAEPPQPAHSATTTSNPRKAGQQRRM